jgi:hypothetical protein|tara:strand:+ start:368 stop:949 length:582 start_codon:yes stop_codon:yes gene_type:complete
MEEEEDNIVNINDLKDDSLIVSTTPTNTGAPSIGSGILPVSLKPLEENPLPTNSTIENLTRNVFDKTSFNKTIDTSFSQLGLKNVPNPSFFDVNLAIIPDFWILYDKFFYDIPKEGATNSHRYLAQTSGDYADFERIQEEINALLDEISELRVENVDLRRDNANLEVLAAEARSLQALEANEAATRETSQFDS